MRRGDEPPVVVPFATLVSGRIHELHGLQRIASGKQLGREGQSVPAVKLKQRDLTEPSPGGNAELSQGLT